MMTKTGAQKGRWSEELKGKCEREYIVASWTHTVKTQKKEDGHGGEGKDRQTNDPLSENV